MQKVNKQILTKIGKIAANVLTGIICVFVLIIAICAIASAGDGYTNFFGKTYLSVGSGSMEPFFSEGDVIKVDVLKDKEKEELKVDDVITFWQWEGGQRILNTHRIVRVGEQATDGTKLFYTKGDANRFEDRGGSPLVKADIVGKYETQAKGIGKVMLFMQTSVGFGVCVVLPSALVLAYCLVIVILNIIQYKKKQNAAKELAMTEKFEMDKEELKAQMLEQAKAELLREQQKEEADGEGKGEE